MAHGLVTKSRLEMSVLGNQVPRRTALKHIIVAISAPALCLRVGKTTLEGPTGDVRPTPAVRFTVQNPPKRTVTCCMSNRTMDAQSGSAPHVDFQRTRSSYRKAPLSGDPMKKPGFRPILLLFLLPSLAHPQTRQHSPYPVMAPVEQYRSRRTGGNRARPQCGTSFDFRRGADTGARKARLRDRSQRQQRLRMLRGTLLDRGFR